MLLLLNRLNHMVWRVLIFPGKISRLARTCICMLCEFMTSTDEMTPSKTKATRLQLSGKGEREMRKETLSFVSRHCQRATDKARNIHGTTQHNIGTNMSHNRREHVLVVC